MLSTRQLEPLLRRIRQLRQELKVACAELHLAHQALQQHLPEEGRAADVHWAIGQNAAVERKLAHLVGELDDLAGLLQAHNPSKN
jgi:hypothetical protein